MPGPKGPRARSQSAGAHELASADARRRHGRVRPLPDGVRFQFASGAFSDDDARASDSELALKPSGRPRRRRRGNSDAAALHQAQLLDALSGKHTLPRTLRVALSRSVGNLRGLWADVADHLKHRDSAATPLRVHVATWNMNGHVPDSTDIAPLLAARDSVDSPHVIAVGTQECARSIEQSVLLPSKEEWEVQLLAHLGSAYDLIAAETMTAVHLAVFVRRPLSSLVGGVRASHVATGIANVLGNKGAIGISLTVGQHSLLFVNAHLPAHQHATSARSHDYWRINEELALPGYHRQDAARALATDRFDYVFWFGDLNYRVNGTRKMVDALLDRGDLDVLLGNDQLQLERRRGAAFTRFDEDPIAFMPTYKVDIVRPRRGVPLADNSPANRRRSSDASSSAASNSGRFSQDRTAVVSRVDPKSGDAVAPRPLVYDTSPKARIPAWTDRILFKARLSDDIESELCAQLHFAQDAAVVPAPPLPEPLSRSDAKAPAAGFTVLSSLYWSLRRWFGAPALPQHLGAVGPIPSGTNAPESDDPLDPTTPLSSQTLMPSPPTDLDNSPTAAKLDSPTLENADGGVADVTAKSPNDTLSQPKPSRLILKDNLPPLPTQSTTAGAPLPIGVARIKSVVLVDQPSDASVAETSPIAPAGSRATLRRRSSVGVGVGNAGRPPLAPVAQSAQATPPGTAARDAKSPQANLKRRQSLPQPNSLSSSQSRVPSSSAAISSRQSLRSTRPTPILRPPRLLSSKSPAQTQTAARSTKSKSVSPAPSTSSHQYRHPAPPPCVLRAQTERNHAAIKVLEYRAVPAIRASDHIPVVASFSLPEVIVEQLVCQPGFQRNAKGFWSRLFQRLPWRGSAARATAAVHQSPALC